MLNPEERKDLAKAFLDRKPLTDEQGLEAVRSRFPNASHHLINAARFHLFVDLPDALQDLMAKLELCLRDPSRELELYGEVSHLIYHLYNYYMIEALIPTGNQKLIDLVEDLRACVNSRDLRGVDYTVERLEDLLSGSTQPPDHP